MQDESYAREVLRFAAAGGYARTYMWLTVSGGVVIGLCAVFLIQQAGALAQAWPREQASADLLSRAFQVVAVMATSFGLAAGAAAAFVVHRVVAGALRRLFSEHLAFGKEGVE